jgi:lipopolysaccharide transport system permease protein
MNAGAYVLGEQSSLIRSAAFPTVTLVLAQAIAKLIEFMAAMALVLPAVALLHHGAVPPSWIFLPVLLAIQFFVVLGLTLPIAAMSAFHYDIQHALPIALTALFYVSPVFYPASMVPESFRTLYMLNPLAGLLTAYQQVVHAGSHPSGELLATNFLAAGLLLGMGYWVFDRYSGVYAEVV